MLMIKIPNVDFGEYISTVRPAPAVYIYIDSLFLQIGRLEVKGKACDNHSKT